MTARTYDELRSKVREEYADHVTHLETRGIPVDVIAGWITRFGPGVLDVLIQMLGALPVPAAAGAPVAKITAISAAELKTKLTPEDAAALDQLHPRFSLTTILGWVNKYGPGILVFIQQILSSLPPVPVVQPAPVVPAEH